MRGIERKICPECSIEFNCGGQCWCGKYPHIIPLHPNNGCFCESCFHMLMVREINKIMNELTPEMEKKIKNLGPTLEPIKDIDYTEDENGNRIMSKWYQLRSGQL